MSTHAESAAEHCQRLVRDFDRDRYLASLFVPDSLRPHVLALYAFNVELARIREQVSEPGLGEIRLQWWRDAIEGIFSAATPEAPVAQALAHAIDQADLPRHAFLQMVEARRFDLYDDPMPDMATLEGYLGETSSALIQLAGLVLAGPDMRNGAAASGLAGVAYGMTGLMRSIPIHRARGQCYMPADHLASYGSSPQQVLSGRLDEPTGLALAELRRHALRRLGEARERHAEVPAKALPAFLPVCLMDLYLDRLGRKGFNPLRSVSEVSQMRKQLRLLRFAYSERF